jgi:glycosyltransferase involved in cell wall biosynthesis
MQTSARKSAAGRILPPHAFAEGPLLLYHQTLCCGGVGRQLSLTARELHRRGIGDIHLLCTSLSPGNDFFLQATRPALEGVHILGEPPESMAELLPLAIRALAPFRRFSGEEQADLALHILWMLHLRPRCVHVWHADLPHVALAACIAGVPRVILSGRSLSPLRRTPLGMEGPDVEKTARMYTELCAYPFIMTNNSRAGKEDYAAWLKYPVEKIHIFQNTMPVHSIDEKAKAELKKRLGLAPDSRIIGGAFRFSAIKDPRLWLAAAQKALAQLENTAAVLWGDGRLHAECRNAVQIAGLEKKILLPGKAHDGIAALSIADVVLLTSRVEGLPNVVLEAQSLGIPVVTTRAGGVADALEHGSSGWIVTRRSAEALAERLVFVLRNEEWAKKAKERAISHIRDNFSFERSLRPLMALYAGDVSSSKFERSV